MPRLELCGAVLLSNLAHKCIQALNFEFVNKYFWCDSSIVLSWIAGEPSNWKTFVAHRVTNIHKFTKKHEWRHVPTLQNPADIISRGTTPQMLKTSKLWWLGPEFITKNDDCWPQNIVTTSELPESRKQKYLNFANITSYDDQSIFLKFSTFLRLVRSFAYMLRFINNCKKDNVKQVGNLTVTETHESLNVLIKMVQYSSLNDELQRLTNGNKVSKKSKLFSLSPFIKDGIIRVGGRLKNSSLLPDRKNQILLPSHHTLTYLIIQYYHKINMHSGVQATLAAVRYKYWPIHGKNAVKRVIFKCVDCFKIKPTIQSPLMGNLPNSRIEPARPFLKVGCDFAGPILVRPNQLRCRTLVKTYICIFVCFVTHAVHIELAGDLSTPCFLSVLKRFVARRGVPTDIFSDNGSNFIGASRELNKIFTELRADELSGYLSKNEISWHFIPPRSPHFGGLWESAVKSAKFHLIRVLKGANLSFEHLYTVLCQIEAILNSRPLTPLSCDPNDYSPLTPSHFLIGDVLTAIPEKNVSEMPTNRLLLYDRLKQLVQHFWQRWSGEYLNTLQNRTKWRSADDTNNLFKIGALVLLHEDGLPPYRWKLGRITDVHPGNENIIRVVTVKTENGLFKRSVQKISVLPLDNSA